MDLKLKYSQALKFLWLTVYADMITNLLLFFLSMWSFTLIEPQVRKQIFAQIATYLKESPGSGEIKLERTEIKDVQKLQIDETRTYIIPPEPISFLPCSAELTEAAIQTLQLILFLLKVIQIINLY